MKLLANTGQVNKNMSEVKEFEDIYQVNDKSIYIVASNFTLTY